MNCLVEHQVRSRERYVKYYIEASHKTIGMMDNCEDPKSLVMLMNSLEQCQSGEFKALAITDKTNEYLFRQVDHREINDESQQQVHIIDKAIENLRNDKENVIKFFKVLYEYGRLKGVDIQALLDEKVKAEENGSEEKKPEERH